MKKIGGSRGALIGDLVNEERENAIIVARIASVVEAPEDHGATSVLQLRVASSVGGIAPLVASEGVLSNLKTACCQIALLMYEGVLTKDISLPSPPDNFQTWVSSASHWTVSSVGSSVRSATMHCLVEGT